ncbi:MAG TPA: thaumatin family protein [Polyangiaceae bacterium]
MLTLAGMACAALVGGCGSSSASGSSVGDAGEGQDAAAFDAGGTADGRGPGGDAALEAASPTDAPTGTDTGSASDGSAGPPACPSGKRPFRLVNRCTQSVQVALTAGATTTACGSNGTCAPVGTCNTSNGLCYWPLPDLGPSHGEMAPGASLTVCFDAPVAGLSTQWSGNLAARIGCDASGNCPPQPTTLAEFTLADQTASPPGTDFYDVSIINGLDVGMSMAPVGGTFAAQGGDPYSCAGAGASTSSGSLGACSWSVKPIVGGTDETTWARAVVPGGASCSSDTDCSAGSSCGLAQDGASFTHSCGASLGWWTADQICGVDPGFGAPYDCASTVTNANGTTSTYAQLFGCTGPAQGQSCYSTGAAADCCGCGTDAPAWPKTMAPGFACQNDNPRWQSVAEPWLAFLKQACATAYVYPFDDATSTFTCAPSSNVSPVSYVITFCP